MQKVIKTLKSEGSACRQQAGNIGFFRRWEGIAQEKKGCTSSNNLL
jgi:hypothetical protein